MTVYKTVADMAAEAGTPLHTANIATSISYLALYEFRYANYWKNLHRKTGIGSVIPQSGEDKKPTATDARRVFTAGAIAQTAMQSPDTSIVYVAGQPTSTG